jgi:predicted RNA-binding Zn ribbon-like protein
MEKNQSVATLRIVGGHPSLDLANTVAFRGEAIGPDLLATYGDLLDWSARVGLLDRDGTARLRRLAAETPGAAEAALARVKGLREAACRTFSAVAAGGQPLASDLELLDREARHAQAERRLAQAPSGYAWIWLDSSMDAVTFRLAHAAAELLTTPEVSRVKLCRGRNCGWLFLDTSRNGSRKWCSEEDCGTPARVARHRAKARRGTSDAG